MSAGNYGKAFAFATKEQNLSATLCMPESAPISKAKLIEVREKNYYTLNSLSLFWLAESVLWIIFWNQHLWCHLAADYTIIMSRTLKVILHYIYLQYMYSTYNAVLCLLLTTQYINLLTTHFITSLQYVMGWGIRQKIGKQSELNAVWVGKSLFSLGLAFHFCPILNLLEQTLLCLPIFYLYIPL